MPVDAGGPAGDAHGLLCLQSVVAECNLPVDWKQLLKSSHTWEQGGLQHGALSFALLLCSKVKVKMLKE